MSYFPQATNGIANSVEDIQRGAGSQLYKLVEGVDELGEVFGFLRQIPRHRKQSSRRYVQAPARRSLLQTKAERAPLYKPWLKDFTFSPGGQGVINQEPNTLSDFDSGWIKDIWGTQALSALTGIVSSKIIGFIKGGIDGFMRREVLPRFTDIAGGASAAARSGWTVQHRIFGRTVRVHNVYGRYRMNILTKKIVAADFRGRGPSTRVPLKPINYQSRIVNTHNNVILKYWSQVLDVPGGLSKLEPPQTPEKSFGRFD